MRKMSELSRGNITNIWKLMIKFASGQINNN